MIGQTLSRYRILQKLGEGGMGEVYLAHDERLDRDVALKILRAGMLTDEANRKRFHREALALSRLNHPNIETVHDFDSQAGTDFLITEYIPGTALSEELAAGPLPEKEIVRLGAQLAEGLAAAHEQGVVHRDLKPANLRITPERRIKILDFGLARLQPSDSEYAITESFTETRGLIGTLPYMSPEQVRGETVDGRTDIHALGAVLYEMATGQRPFPHLQAGRLVDAILHATPIVPSQVRPQLSAELERIILKCLEKEPDIRYQSARDLLADFRRLAVAPVAVLPRHHGISRRSMILGGVAVALLLVLFGVHSGGLRDWFTFAPPARIRSLAVLPLENLMGDPEQDYFVDGMTEALISDLAKISALRVISRTSVMQYKDARKPLPEIARDLHVDAVIEGSVFRAGDRVRITAQLIDASSDRHLWAQSYEGELSDILTLQSDVARSIAREIRITLRPQEQTRLTGALRVDPEVHQLYLRGRYHWNQRTEEGFRKSLAYYQEALERDPGYALAYAGLADSYNLLGNYGFLPPREAFPRAKAAAMKALETDELLAEAHTSLAFARHHYDWEWDAAEQAFQRALELNPGYATAHQWYAEYLATIGRHEEALAQIRRAEELDPLSVVIDTNVGRLLYYSHRYEDAIEELRGTLKFDPSYVWGHVFLGMAYEQKGMYREAIEESQTVSTLEGGGPTVGLARVYALQGRSSEARRMLRELEQMEVDSYFIASIYPCLGEREQAFRLLEKAFEEHSFFLVFLRVDPLFQSLHSDPRFGNLLRRMKFPL